jgi:putative addiction module component (TIGR02574 family)
MTKQQFLSQAGSLSKKERLELALDLWDSVESESDDLPLTDSQRSELDRRFAAYMADPENTLPAYQVLDELEKEL